VKRLAVMSLLALAAAACSNAGEGNLTSVGKAGTVKGFVYFDLNGNRAIDPTSDDSVKNIRVRLLSQNSSDTIASALSDVHGFFQMTNVPVGSYLVRVDTTPLADTAIVAALDSSEITLLPDSNVAFNVGISYPHVTIAQARLPATAGKKVFVEGIILNVPTLFRDTTMHVQDNTAAIRMGRVLAPSAPIFQADSARFRGTVSVRYGQPSLEDVATFRITPRFAPAATTVTTLQAASAASGVRDAQQLRVLNAQVTDTATVTGDFRLTVNDGSGALEVLLDCVTAAQFCGPQPPSTLFIPGNRFNIVGIAVPTGTAGLWRLKPRSPAEIVKL
jgi:hypothetical protein